MAKLYDIKFTGESGTEYNFGVWPRVTRFNPAAGLYVLGKVVGTTFHVIYIGQTGDISQRPFNHHKTACFDKNGADLVAIRTFTDEQRRLHAEMDLIHFYTPVCNGTGT